MRGRSKKCIALLLAVGLCLTVGACTPLLEGEYYSAQRYDEELPVQEGSEIIVRSPAALKTAILALVENYETEGAFSVTGYRGEISEDLPRVCADLKANNALCAYAVDYFSYDLGRIVSFYEARVFVNFRRSAAQVQALRSVGSVTRVEAELFSAMRAGETSLVLQAAGPELNTAVLQEMAQAYYYSAPLECLQLPYVSLNVYPNTGIYRIYEIDVNYGGDESSRPALTERLSEAVSGLCAEIRAENETAGGDELAMAELAAQKLSERCEWAQGASGYSLTAYGALVNSRASDEGMAMAYKALCDVLGLDCIVVSGRMDKAPHVWNMVRPLGSEENYRHVDVSRLRAEREAGGEVRALRSEIEMWGSYWWDIDRYPFYGETLSVFDPEAEHEAQPEEAEQTEPPEDEPPEDEPQPEPSEPPDGA